MVTASHALTPSERKILQTHEDTIERGLHSFVEVGRALTAIRDERLYEGYQTFEAYCSKRWKLGKSRAYQLIDASKVVEVTSTIVDVEPPQNEAQARVLAGLESPQAQATVWKKAVETAPKDSDGNPNVTAAHVRKIAGATAVPNGRPKKTGRGEPTVDARKFADMKSQLGKCVRLNSAIKEQAGGADYHETIRQHLNGSLKVLEAWRKHALA